MLLWEPRGERGPSQEGCALALVPQLPCLSWSSSPKPEAGGQLPTAPEAPGPVGVQGWGWHLVGKKAWQDLACSFKNKVWVGGDYCIVLFFISGKSGKKLHLNWHLLASLQHSGNREAFGWRLKETQAGLPFLPAGLPSVLTA